MNTTRIVVKGPHVEHWLNGRKVVEFERRTPEWNKLRDSGKWKEAPDYGKSKIGRIVLQDHGSIFWFRNIKSGRSAGRELGGSGKEGGEEEGTGRRRRSAERPETDRGRHHRERVFIVHLEDEGIVVGETYLQSNGSASIAATEGA